MSFFTRQGYGRMFFLLMLVTTVAVPNVSYAQATQNMPTSQTPQYVQETNPVQTVYEPSPQLPAKSKQIVSFGSGMFYANDYGGVKGVSIPMPNLGFGGYLFFDLIYVGRRCEAI